MKIHLASFTINATIIAYNRGRERRYRRRENGEKKNTDGRTLRTPSAMASKSGALPLSPSIEKEEKKERKNLNSFRIDKFHDGNLVVEDDDDDDKEQEEEEGTDDERNGQFCDVREAVNDDDAEAMGTDTRMPQNNDEIRGNRDVFTQQRAQQALQIQMNILQRRKTENGKIYSGDLSDSKENDDGKKTFTKDVAERNDDKNKDDNDTPVLCRSVNFDADKLTASAFDLLGLKPQSDSFAPPAKKAKTQNGVPSHANEPERRSARLNNQTPSQRPCCSGVFCHGTGCIPDGQRGHVRRNMNEFRAVSNVECCDPCYKVLQNEDKKTRRQKASEISIFCNTEGCERKLTVVLRRLYIDPVTQKPIKGKYMCRDGCGCRTIPKDDLPTCNTEGCEKKLTVSNRRVYIDPVTQKPIKGKYTCPNGRGCQTKKRKG